MQKVETAIFISKQNIVIWHSRAAQFRRKVAIFMGSQKMPNNGLIA